VADGSTIPTVAPSDNVTFTVLLDGRELSGECHVLSLVVTKMANRIAKARIVLLDGDAAQEDFKLSSTALFVPGKSVEIQAGYHSQESMIFRGMIVKHAIKAGRKGASTLIADCRHEAVKLTGGAE
jgi:phage protein D